MRYVTVDELVYINEQVVTGEAIHSIVEGKRAVRDMGLLEAAAARPMASAFGEDAYMTLGRKRRCCCIRWRVIIRLRMAISARQR